MTNETEYQRGYREGAEKMRGDAAMECEDKVHFRNESSQFLCGRIARKIRALPITPPQPAAQAEDDEREMREAFEKWCDEPAQAAMQEAGFPLTAWAAYQAAWKEKSK